MKLTAAQKARFPEFVQKWTKIGLSTEPANREKSEKAIRGLYNLTKLKEPRIIWLPCPLSSALSTVIYAELMNKNVAVDSAVHSAVRSAVRSAVDSAGRSFYGGSLWPGYSAWADYFNEVLDISIDRNYLELTENCGFYWLLDGICFASERPTHINLDSRGRLHSETGQSIGYKSGWGLWHWHGVQVPKEVIEESYKITVNDIQKNTNTEVRRVMIEKYGTERFILDSGAQLVHQDECGQLYKMDFDNTVADPAGIANEPFCAVRVRNSTPEPDGSWKFYFLSVHPECRPILQRENGEFYLGDAQKVTARAAVASTFGMTADEYAESLVAQT
jgi:hypothetical protein